MIKQWIYKTFLKLLAQANEYRDDIDKYTYANNGCTFSSGDNSKVVIGKHCAIGRYVHIAAKGHDLRYPTSDENNVSHQHIEADTIIGNYVWIGDHVFIKHGVTVGDYAVIGANAVVTEDIKSFEIVAGVPAKHIRFNTEHYKYKAQ